MKKIAYSFLILGLLASCGEPKKEAKGTEGEYITIEGVNFPPELSQNSTKLFLNGAGTHAFLFIKIYVAGLYIPTKNYNAEEIIAEDEPSIIRLHAVSRAFISGRLSAAVREQFKSNEEHLEEFQTRMDIMCNRLAAEVIQVGDQLDIAYTPGEGVRFFKNGKDINMLIPGLDFKQALFRTFLSDHPADEALKKAMLGL